MVTMSGAGHSGLGLDVRDVTVRHAGVEPPAVSQVSVRVNRGEVVALLGPSGCGKSTLLRAIAGLQPLEGGSVHWDGVDLARVPSHRRGFGLMFQDEIGRAHV
jgi:thiamine transport system ATP-binding protein